MLWRKKSEVRRQRREQATLRPGGSEETYELSAWYEPLLMTLMMDELKMFSVVVDDVRQ